MEWNPNGGSTKQGWRSTGLEGRTCYGGTVAGNMLVVSLRNRAGVYEVWAFDGTGWWLMKSTTAAARVWPVHLAGAGNIDLVAFRNGDSAVSYDLYRMIHRDAVSHAYASSGKFMISQCSMLVSVMPTNPGARLARFSQRQSCGEMRRRPIQSV